MDYLTIDGDLYTHGFLDTKNPKGGDLNPQQLSKLKMERAFDLEAHASSSGITSTIDDANFRSEDIPGGSKLLPLDNGISECADIGKFLNRRVQIHTSQWTVGTDYAQTLHPWELFLSNTAVRHKLDNYYLLKGKLNMYFYINGTPFHAGLVLASYLYLSNATEHVTIGGDTQFVTRSQRPHVWLNASTSKSGCLCVPFISPQNYLGLHGVPPITANGMGILHLGSLAPLQQINAGTDKVTITIFADMSDVTLTGPAPNDVALSGLLSQSFADFDIEAHAGKSKKNSKGSKDEYEEDGPISGPASTIATIAGMLGNAPVIGPLALATQMGAQSVSKFARFFGYSKPVLIEDPTYVRPLPIGNMAVTDGADTSLKMTVTSKQELSIDPAIAGFSGDDELAICSFAQRESYFTQFPWKVTDLVDDYIFSCDINPSIRRFETVSGGHRLIPTSLSFVSRMFDAWSGTLKFRFQVIASQYHRGRLAIVYVPRGILGTTEPFNTTYNTIIDLADGRDFTVEFGWQQAQPYMFTKTQPNYNYFTDSSGTPEVRLVDAESANGIFVVRVVNELVVPDGISDVNIAVSVSAGDDFELMNPTGKANRVFPYAPVAQSSDCTFDWSLFDLESHSGELDGQEDDNAPEAEKNMIEVTEGVENYVDDKPKMFYGERILSLRQLIKRYSFFRGLTFHNTLLANWKWDYIMYAFPPEGGYDPNGIDRTSSNTPYFYHHTNPLAYMRRAFCGWRGSIRYKFTAINGITNLVVTRAEDDGFRNHSLPYLARNAQALNVTGTNGSSMAEKMLRTAEKDWGGIVKSINRTVDSLEVEIPYALPQKFSTTGPIVDNNNMDNAYPGGNAFTLGVEDQDDRDCLIEAYVAAGEDFAFFGFTGAPVIYSHTIPPGNT